MLRNLFNMLFGNTSSAPSIAPVDPLDELRSDAALARQYYHGQASLPLSERQQRWLQATGMVAGFRVNICQIVVRAINERLRLTRFSVRGDDASLSERVEKAVNRIWDERVAPLQSRVYRQTSIDGITFVAVDFTDDGPVFVHHPLSLDPDSGEPGADIFFSGSVFGGVEGVALLYTEDGKPRRILYRPGLIAWQTMRGTGQWETDKARQYTMRDGTPMPIPVGVFVSPEGRSDIKEIVPLQMAYDKVWVNLMAAADDAAFRTPLVKGLVLTEDGKELRPDHSNALRLPPAGVIWTELPPDDVAVDIIPPADLGNLLHLEEVILLRVALATGLPITYLMSSRQVASEGTLKQQEAGLLSRMQERQAVYGDAWERLMKAAMMYEGLRTGAWTPEEVAALRFQAHWAPLSVRSEEELARQAAEAAQHGVPLEERLKRYFGYTEEEVQRFASTPEFRAARAMAEMTVAQAEATKRMTGGGE